MQTDRRGGGGRFLVLGILFLGCLGGAVYVYLDQIKAVISGETGIGSSKSAEGPGIVDVKQVVKPRGKVLYLLADQTDRPFEYPGLVLQEVFRQGLLIAARDEMGLQTRDGSLREWNGTPRDTDSLQMDLVGKEVGVHDVADPPSTWVHEKYPTWPSDFDKGVAKIEAMSRDDFVVMLKSAGWTGSGNAKKADGAPPTDAEKQLGEMEELSQFAVLRETGELIRSDGESPQRLGVLVRAYANLGQLTRYHWSLEYAVYTARALLYAQRLVNENPNSAFALWHRAYARAMAGTFKGALEDLDAAEKLKGETAPDWVALLEPFCRYQTGKLVNLATANANVSGLGTFLAFLSVENSGSQGAVMSIAQAAFAMNPNCLRLVDAMCARTGPGMLNELSQTGPQIFSRLMGTRLETMPKFPQALSDEIEGFKRPGGNPTGRETICQELIARGSPEKDSVEPSWGALGRMIQETTFAHVRVMSDLIAVQWGVDASDYVSQSLPLVKDHPYRFLIEAYGKWDSHENYAVMQSLKVPKSIVAVATMRELPLYYVMLWTKRDADGYWRQILGNGDFDVFDMDAAMQYQHAPNPNQWVLDEVDHLAKTSPDSPQVMAWQICYHFNATDAAKYEAEQGDYPTVSCALGQTYVDRKQWADAERCWKKYIAVSPDYEGYEALAKVYQAQKEDEKWLATLNEYLSKGQDYGLQDSLVQEEIANYYMDKRDFKSAVPYADAASATASAGGMFCSANAHTGIGDFATAEQLYKDEIDHYSDTPWRWYRWCAQTGHGDMAAARKMYEDFVLKKGERMTADDLLFVACAAGGSGFAVGLRDIPAAPNGGPGAGVGYLYCDDRR